MIDLLIIQHENDTPPGSVLEWASARELKPQIWKISESSTAPCKPEEVKALVICGGGMDTFEEELHPWLIDEKAFIKKCVLNKTPTFGLCLGSQLLAEVLGGRVYPMKKWEVGFVPVRMADQTEPYNLNVFHWHQCTFDLPPGAELLATNDFCQNQAYRWGSHVIATQFHPEATTEWIQECAQDVKPEQVGLVQSEKQILDSLHLQRPLQSWFFKTLNEWYPN